MPTTCCQNSLPNLKEVAVIIGLNACNTTVCPPCDLLGSILYNGGYNPLLDLSPPGGKPPYQNFSLSIASSFQKGRAQLNIFHVALNGVSILALVIRSLRHSPYNSQVLHHSLTLRTLRSTLPDVIMHYDFHH